MDFESIHNYESLIRLELSMASSDALLELLRNNRLVRKRGKKCCNRAMRECPLGKGGVFKKTWRCSVCRNTSTILKGSFFENSKLDPFTIMKVAYAYLVTKVNLSGMSRMMSGAPRSENLLDWLQFCRDVLSRDLLQETHCLKLGGPNKVVVVDTTTIEKGKRSQVRVTEHNTTICILGLYDVEAKIGQLVLLEDQSQEAIIPLIHQYVAEGSRCLMNRYFSHCPTDNSREFEFVDGVHKNIIKGYFSRLKKYLRGRHSTHAGIIPSYLDEYMWMDLHKDDVWPSFIRAVQRQYRC